MKLNRIKVNLLYAIFIFTAGFAACEDDDERATADRLFRPVLDEVLYGGTWISTEWKKYEQVEQFRLQLSVDSFETFAADVTTDTTYYRFSDLEYDTKYYLRIKALGDELESRYYVNDIITTLDYPTQLDPVDKIIDSKVKVTWTEAEYDSMVVSRNDTIVTSVGVTADANSRKEIVIGGLTPETSYVVRAYSDGNYMGKKEFLTTAAQVFDGEVYDLRDLTDEEAYSVLTQTFFDGLAQQYPEGVNLVLKGGTEYELTGARMSSSVNFVTGLSLEGNAIIRVNGNFDFPESGTANIGKYTFNNITFTDHPDKLQDFSSTYVFNFGSGGHVDTIAFDGCVIRYKRGMLRIKTAAGIGTISINNCIIDSIGGYGVINLDNGAAGADHIKITNTTISHVASTIVSARKTNLQPATLTVENVTTCFVPEGGYLFDLDKKTFEGGIEISHCLLGKPWGDEISIRGLRSAGTSVTFSGNYKTSDLNWEVDEKTFEEQYPIEASDLGDDIYSVFEDPDHNNYSLINNVVKNSAGDPRWW